MTGARRVLTISEPALRIDAAKLAQRVEGTFAPQVVVGVATGGAVVAKMMTFSEPTTYVEVRLQRPSSAVKERMAGSRRILRRLPYFISDRLRLLEDMRLRTSRSNVSSGRSERCVELREIRQLVEETGATRLLVVDDAVDSGETLDAIISTLERQLPSSIEVRSCAIVVTRDEGERLRSPDFVLYANALCRFPWSYDFHG